MFLITYPPKSSLVTSAQPKYRFIDLSEVIEATIMDDENIHLKFRGGANTFIEKTVAEPVKAALFNTKTPI